MLAGSLGDAAAGQRPGSLSGEAGQLPHPSKMGDTCTQTELNNIIRDRKKPPANEVRRKVRILTRVDLIVCAGGSFI